jgi:sugar lactone lactonase YvrE
VRRSYYGRVLGIVGGTGATAGRFLEPAGLDTDPTGNVYVADSGNDRVQKLDHRGAPLALFGPATPGLDRERLKAPHGVAVGPDGDIFVADTGNDRIVRFSPQGRVRAAWRPPDGLRAPGGIAIDAAGTAYVADTGHDRVLAFTSGAPVTAWGERGIAPGQFIGPAGVDVDCRGVILVADRGNHRVQRFLPLRPVTRRCAAPPALPAPPPRITLLRVERRTGILARRSVSLRVRCAPRCDLTASAALRPRAGGPASRCGRRRGGCLPGAAASCGWGCSDETRAASAAPWAGGAGNCG